MDTVRTILDKITYGTDVVNEISYIDHITREVTVAPKESVFGVRGDDNSEKKYFAVPRHVSDEFDMARCTKVQISYIAIAQDNTSYSDAYETKDFAYNDEWFVFSWLLSRNACQYVGTISFSCNFMIEDAQHNITNQWDTAIAHGKIVNGIINSASASNPSRYGVVLYHSSSATSSTTGISTSGTTTGIKYYNGGIRINLSSTYGLYGTYELFLAIKK